MSDASLAPAVASRFSAIEAAMPSPPLAPSIERIQRLVAAHYDIARAELCSARRTARLIRPRHVAMYLAWTMTSRSSPTIGRCFGGRDHTTILSAVRRIEALAEADPALGREVDDLRRRLEEA